METTFYVILASHYTKTLPANGPLPRMRSGWVAVTRFSREGSMWSSEVLSGIRPTIVGINLAPNAVAQVACAGSPSWNCDLLRSPDLVRWQVVTNPIPSTNSTMLFTDGDAVGAGPCFYSAALQ
jgi:hypothetical protein